MNPKNGAQRRGARDNILHVSACDGSESLYFQGNYLAILPFLGLGIGARSRDGSSDRKNSLSCPLTVFTLAILPPRCFDTGFTRTLERTPPHAHASSMMLIQGKIRDEL